MNQERRPPDVSDETIAPDVATSSEKPLRPEQAIDREEDIYGESSLDENREDQRDMHRGTPEDIV